jgi:tetratricopeptide (TPR) repeat protein
MAAEELTDVSNEISDGIFFSTVIQGRNITIQLPPPATTSLHGLPAGSEVFTGRDLDLERVLTQLRPRPRGRDDAPGRPAVVLVTAVGGLAGVGKTELAVQAARRAQASGWFPGGALFVDMFGYDTGRRQEPGQALDSLLRALGVPGDRIPPEVQDRARLYASILASYAREGRRLLVVIDNVSTHEQVRALLPTDGETGAIVTSRHTLGMLDARLLDLDILPIDDAASLLDGALQMARPGDTRIARHPEDARRVAELCAGLPLALRIVAGLLARDEAHSLSDMAARLADAGLRLEQMSFGDRAVRAAFDLSYQDLDQGQERLFRLLSLNPGPEISTEAVAILTGLNSVRARRGLESLARAHLVERGVLGGRWRMHDLVRSFAGGLAARDPERRTALEHLFSWYAHSVNAADAVMRPGRIRPDLGAYAGERLASFGTRNDALTWCDVEQSNLAAAVHSGAGEDLGHLIWSIPLSMWGFLTQTLSWDSWIDAHQVAAQAAGQCGAFAGQGWLLNNLGTGYRALGRPAESREAFAAGLEVRRRLGDLHGQADSLKDMAMAARVWEEFDEALRLSYEALEILGRLTAPDLSGTASTLDTIAVCLSNLGRLGEAAQAANQALAIWESVGGTRDDRGWARTKLLLADLTRREGRSDQAAAEYREALAIFELIRDEWDQADTLRGLGELFAATGPAQVARDYLAQAQEIYERLGASSLTEEMALAIQRLSPETPA